MYLYPIKNIGKKSGMSEMRIIGLIFIPLKNLVCRFLSKKILKQNHVATKFLSIQLCNILNTPHTKIM
jgi:hypothetical protein